MNFEYFDEILILVLIFGILIYFYVKRRSKIKYLLNEGIETSGFVVDFIVSHEGSNLSQNKKAIIKFKTKEGNWIKEEYNTIFVRLKLDQELKIFYDRSNPRDFIIRKI